MTTIWTEELYAHQEITEHLNGMKARDKYNNEMTQWERVRRGSTVQIPRRLQKSRIPRNIMTTLSSNRFLLIDLQIKLIKRTIGFEV